MRSLRLLTAAAIAAGTLMAAAPSGQSTTNASARQFSATITHLRHGIAWHRSMTWHYQDRAGVSRTRTVYAERHTRSAQFLSWINRLWWHRQHAAARLHAHWHQVSGAVGHLALWLCIHSREGAWNANTGNGFFGGLQMTSGWGGVSRPDLLSANSQMALAERQYAASGYSTVWLEGQWPNTSPPCLSYA